MNLGTVRLTGNYVNGNRSFTASAMVLSGGGTVVTITLGTPSNTFLTETVAGTMPGQPTRRRSTWPATPAQRPP